MKGFCNGHYQRWKRHGENMNRGPLAIRATRHSERCTVEGCHAPYHAKGFCKRCYGRHRRRIYQRRPEYREKKNRRERERYWNDTEYRERVKAKERARYYRLRDKRLAKSTS